MRYFTVGLKIYMYDFTENSRREMKKLMEIPRALILALI